MRKEFGKIARASFSGKMKSLLPEYQEEKINSQYSWPGERAFGKRVNESVSCWIVLSPNPKDYDEFTILIGWSTRARYPELTMIPSLNSPTTAHEEFKEPEYLIRLPQLWTDNDEWWVIKPFQPATTIEQLQASIAPIGKAEAEALVLPQIDDAFEKLVNIGLPYLNKYIDYSDVGN